MGNAGAAWRQLDRDVSGTITLREWDFDSANLLGSFKTWPPHGGDPEGYVVFVLPRRMIAQASDGDRKRLVVSALRCLLRRRCECCCLKTSGRAPAHDARGSWALFVDLSMLAALGGECERTGGQCARAAYYLRPVRGQIWPTLFQICPIPAGFVRPNLVEVVCLIGPRL